MTKEFYLEIILNIVQITDAITINANNPIAIILNIKKKKWVLKANPLTIYLSYKVIDDFITTEVQLNFQMVLEQL